MPRPKNNRIVHEPPLFTEFKPIGFPAAELERVVITLDEYEAVRLADFIGMQHEEAADEMGITRSTFSRLVEQARKKVAGFMIKGKIMSVEGGEVHFRNNIIRCHDCGHMFKINIESPINDCPVCGSKNLINLAGGFGHGNCCRGHKHLKRR